MQLPRCARLCTLLFLALSVTAGNASARDPAAPGPTESSREIFVRSRLHDARSFLRDGRMEAAEHAARRGLDAAPDDARLHVVLARVLTARGLATEAALHRRRADDLAPPPPPLARGPLVDATPDVVILLVPPPTGTERPDRVPRDWPDAAAAATLEQRLALRLPSTTVEFASPQDVAEARAWLADREPRGVVSLRVERSYCADTLKDGLFAVARLRAVAALPRSAEKSYAPADPETRDEIVYDPRGSEGCAAEALGRVLERTLASPAVQRVLRAPTPVRSAPAERWPTASIRALFPEIGERLETTLAQGRTQLAMGRVAAAAETFRRAAGIDPEDPAVHTYIAEAEATIAMANELAAVQRADEANADDHGELDPRLSPAQRAAAEARLAVVRQRRADLLAGREVLDEGAAAPTHETLAALRSGSVPRAPSFGTTKALERAPGGVDVRVALAPDGSEIARYYLARGGSDALIREEDLDGDGAPDRWVSYADGNRRESWEDGRGGGTPDLHLLYSEDGVAVDRVEIDTSGDGRIDRIFDYTGGDLRTESRDTDDDGVFDRFVRFDAEGRVESREEDLDGDGRIDTSTTYRAGRLLERSFRERSLAPDDT